MRITLRKKVKYYFKLDQKDMDALMEIVRGWRDNARLLPDGSISYEVDQVYNALLDASIKGKA